MLCIGHRGAMGYEPENTLLSIQKALELGVDGIEIDVRNVENRLVVIHDRDLSRTTNGNGIIEDCSFTYLRSLDAGKGEKIPTLAEVFDLVDRQVLINIELKGNNTAKLVAGLIQDYIKTGWSDTDFLVSSFNHSELNLFKTLVPQIKIGILIYGLPWQYTEIAKKLNAEIIIINLDYVDTQLVSRVQQEDLQLWVYTVNRPQDINRMRKLGIDGIFTNYPDLVKG